MLSGDHHSVRAVINSKEGYSQRPEIQGGIYSKAKIQWPGIKGGIYSQRPEKNLRNYGCTYM